MVERRDESLRVIEVFGLEASDPEQLQWRNQICLLIESLVSAACDIKFNKIFDLKAKVEGPF